MPIRIADSNFLGEPALSRYLSRSRYNRIALPEAVLVEMHKDAPVDNIRKSLEIARRFPKQVIVLRGVTSIYGVPVRSAADARKLIDQHQTDSFAKWYDDVLMAEYDHVMAGLLSEAQTQAKVQIDEVAQSVMNIEPIFRKMKNRFTKDEREQLRNRLPYSRETQGKLLDLMYEMSHAMFDSANVPENQRPRLNVEAFQYFIYRYAMCMVLYYTRWVNTGSMSNKIDKLVNDVMDLHIAAQATFFDGVSSNDRKLLDVYREARHLLRATGVAYVG